MAIVRVQLPHVGEEEFPAFHKHVSPPTFNGGPLDRVEPTRRIGRKLAVNIDAVFPNGEKLKRWALEDTEDKSDSARTFPSKLIRTVEGDVVHASTQVSVNTHTIHWHGIEPSPVNDGVGKTSFEVSGNFVYQFATSHPGTFFYHCHKNTPLHFELGLYGAFIVDPKKPNTAEAAGIEGPPYKTGGPGFCSAYNPPTNVRKYDVEVLWAVDEIQSNWFDLNHDAFMQKDNPKDPIGAANFTHDGILNNFQPDVFTISGFLRKKNDTTPFNEVAANVKVDQTLLMRVISAGYTVQEYRIGLPTEVTSMDGYALGVSSSSYSKPFKLAANQPFRLTSAMRWELIAMPTQPGQFPVECRIMDWITLKELYVARTFINVT